MKLGDLISGQITGATGSIVDKIVGQLNTAAKQVDLSGIKTPTIKTDNKFGGPIVWAVVAVVVALLFFKKS